MTCPTQATPEALIELRDIRKTYLLGEIRLPVLRGISLRIHPGEYVALMGTSGSGKTTLMNILGCLDRPSSGDYWLHGEEVGRLDSDSRAVLRHRNIGFVFQSFNLLPRTSAIDNVTMPLLYGRDHVDAGTRLQRARELLQHLGLGEHLRHEPSQLSGGQQQRVAIARALINQPQVLLADEPTGNLDSSTSEEILRVFRELNEREGVTIILVTHDPNVAKHAKRLIRVVDGVIAAEDSIPNDPAPAPLHAPRPLAGEGEGVRAMLTTTSPPHPGPLPRPGGEGTDTAKQAALGLSGAGSSRGGSAFGLARILGTALTALRRNLMRASLTALGIIIGVAAVIAMMGIGKGSATAIERTIASMGANILLVLPGSASSGGVTFGAGSVKTLTAQDADAILANSPSVRGVAPIVRVRTQVVHGNRNWVPTYIFGTTPDFLSVREWDLAAGESFTEGDVRNAGKLCLLGQRLVRELFPDESPLGREVRVQNVPFRVIGILSSKGANMMGLDQDDILLAPWTTIKNRVAGTSAESGNQSATTTSSTASASSPSRLYPSSQRNLYPGSSSSQGENAPSPVRFVNVDQIYVATRGPQSLASAIGEITQILRERHRIRASQADDFNIRDMTETSKTLSSTAGLMTQLLLAVALISLLVGGVGIMNIMLVSVTERTREIGLRMALGAKARHILQQFLVESLILSFAGGIIGILLGEGTSYLVARLLGWPTELAPGAIAAAFGVSAAVGILFGYYPAWKASRLDPIQALRYE